MSILFQAERAPVQWRKGVIGDVTEECRGDQGAETERTSEKVSGHRSGQRAKGSIGIHWANGRTMAWL